VYDDSALKTKRRVPPPERCGATARLRPAFTLIELLIVVVILGILATVVIPQFSNASQQARENTLKDELQYLRTQIAVFKAQHEDVPPGYPAGNPTGTPTTQNLNDQLTLYTDINCNTAGQASATFSYGPYLSQLPANPINGMSTFEMIGNNQAMPPVDGTTGWMYQPQTQQIVANALGNDSSGIPYASY
jgi:prepilin-type N-terminal cleavage/methylation domain-containing protein